MGRKAHVWGRLGEQGASASCSRSVPPPDFANCLFASVLKTYARNESRLATPGATSCAKMWTENVPAVIVMMKATPHEKGRLAEAILDARVWASARSGRSDLEATHPSYRGSDWLRACLIRGPFSVERRRGGLGLPNAPKKSAVPQKPSAMPPDSGVAVPNVGTIEPW